MKAISQNRYGSADVLTFQDVALPTLGDHDIMVRVRAAGVDRGVWHTMTGLPYLIRALGYGLRGPKQPICGHDFAGEVHAVGKNIRDFKPGDAVFGTCEGAFAEYARCRAETIAHKPKNLTFVQAAAVPSSAATALRAIRDIGVSEKQRVLIIGASGGVGTYAVQLAKAAGANVTGVCSSGKAQMVRAVGADEIIDYTNNEITDFDRKWDVIIDIAGNRPLSQLRRVLHRDGTLMILGGEGGGRWFGGVERQLGAMMLSPFINHQLRAIIAEPKQEDLQELARLIESGQLRPIMDCTYPLAQAPDAIRHLTDGRARGKVVITVDLDQPCIV